MTRPGNWTADDEAIPSALERVSARDPREEWPPSEVFGKLTSPQWGALLRTHIDHHLKQFGA